jgi:ubiquinone/menaquinone biosynthesis C-methylase UbiE
LDRIRAEYARRARDPRLQRRYSLFQPDVQLALQMRERAILEVLRRAGFEPLAGLDVLDLGCGEGQVLLDLLRWGADAEHLHGCDLLPERLAAARRRLPAATALALANGGALPYPATRFHLVLQFTVFTSVRDETLRQQIAAEMWRVLRPGGAVLWYDFRFQGRNPAVQAIHPRQVRALFPRGSFTGRRITLAPPIARPLARWSRSIAALLARIPWLCSHDLILITKKGSQHARLSTL